MDKLQEKLKEMEEEESSINKHPVGLCKRLRDKMELFVREVELIPPKYESRSEYVESSVSLEEIKKITNNFDKNITEPVGGLLGMYYFFKHKERKFGHPTMFNGHHPLDNLEVVKFHYKPDSSWVDGSKLKSGPHEDPLDDISSIVWMSDTSQIEINHANSELFYGHLAFVSSRDLKDFMEIKDILKQTGYEDISKRPNQPRGLNLR